MRKLNGWKRIGIVVSVVWILCALGYTLDVEDSRNADLAVSITESCIEAHNGVDPGGDQCLKRGQDFVMSNLKYNWMDAGAVALIPVPLVWAFAYLVLFLVRWIKRGFQFSAGGE